MAEKKPVALLYFFNVISLLGALLAVVATGLIIALFAVELITGVENPYLGILTYYLFPGMLIAGLVIIPLGMYRERARFRASGQIDLPTYPRLDLNDRHTRRLGIFFVLSSIIFVVIVMVSTIKGYEFSESPVFCGELCHKVMEPEHTAWRNSPHAKVKCVECHVGPGAQWYVKAKISGMRQLYAVVASTYPRPIETPIANLRPARDTCEHCHWPAKFYGGRQKIFYHFAPNEKNSPRQVNLLLDIGGSPETLSAAKGIHWHIGQEITYIARDRRRQDIPYVAVADARGKVTEYVSTEKPLTKEEIARGERRLVDCIECHNRPTHIYHSPAEEMDLSFISGRIDVTLPYIKKVAVEILSRQYSTAEEAEAAIRQEIPAYYGKNYPKVSAERQAAIKQATDEVVAIYGRNFFPHMKVAWNTYPDNKGHLYFAGCFRCHDGKHKSPEGRIISKDCNLCHQVLGQKQENIPAGARANKFVHPVDIGDEIMKTNCSECHGVPVEETASEEGHH
jgi:hypothetical protein